MVKRGGEGPHVVMWPRAPATLRRHCSPYFRKIFKLRGKLSQFYLFTEKFLDFHPPKFLMTFYFLSLTTNFEFHPIFPVSVHSPLFRENYYFSPPTLTNFPLCFRQIHLRFTYFTCISFPPYFDHDAFMHHPMHVLDAPARKLRFRRQRQVSEGAMVADVRCHELLNI